MSYSSDQLFNIINNSNVNDNGKIVITSLIKSISDRKSKLNSDNSEIISYKKNLSTVLNILLKSKSNSTNFNLIVDIIQDCLNNINIQNFIQTKNTVDQILSIL